MVIGVLRMRILNFGKKNITDLVGKLFWLGIIPITLCIYSLIKHISTDSVPIQIIRRQSLNSADLFVPEANNQPLYLFIGIVCWVTSIAAWKIICEIIFIKVNYYIKNTCEKSDN
jgi:hypothetical protein